MSQGTVFRMLCHPDMGSLVISLISSRRGCSAVVSSMQAMLYHHFLSYDMSIMPTLMFHIPPMLDPLAELSGNTFYQLIWLFILC
jgi:hypothetical protein